jgi:hypothetical protein
MADPKPDTPVHEQVETLRVDVEYPEHVQRTESAEFAANKHRLINRMGLPCWNPSCGGTDKLEVHHYIIEWSEWDNADPAKVLKIMHRFDAYGFAADGVKQGDPPPTSPDDLRNLVVLCETCHRGACQGIHQVPLPFWFANAVRKDGSVVLKPPAKP